MDDDYNPTQMLLAVSPKVDGFEPDLLDENVQLTTNMLDSELASLASTPNNLLTSAQPSQRDMK